MRCMRTKLFFLFVISALLAACSSGQVPTQDSSVEVSAPVQAQPTAAPATQAIDAPQADTPTVAPLSVGTPERKEPLPEDAWKSMPVVPTGVSDRARAIYEYGLSQGTDPTHFSIIGDCQNVSSYFMSAFDTPGEYSLGEYAYLQPTIDYYHGSFSRKSLAVKGGFNAAAVISPLRADPKSCNSGESPLDCELRTWKPSVVIVSMETWWSEKPAEEYDKYMRRVLDRIIETGALPIIARPIFDDDFRMKSAWPWRNLTALQTLDAVHKALAK